MKCLLLLFSAVSPFPVDHVVHCDVIELNHFYQPSSGDIILVQWLFWDINKRSNAKQNVAWRIHKDGRHVLRKIPGGWELSTRDSDGKHFYVQAPDYRESWTPHDPEVNNRKIWPREYRRELTVKSVMGP